MSKIVISEISVVTLFNKESKVKFLQITSRELRIIIVGSSLYVGE